MWNLGCIVLVTLLLLSVIWFCQQRKRKKYFASRPIVSVEEWYKMYGDKNIRQDIAVAVCEALAKDIGVNLTQIYPTDRLDKDVVFKEWWGWGKWSDELINFDYCIEKFLKDRNIKMPVVFSSKTVGDFLEDISYL